MKKASWKTTLGGAILALGPVIKHSVTPDLAWLGDAAMTLGALILGAAARDNNVSSEQAGAKK